jgi:hypothetical protein
MNESFNQSINQNDSMSVNDEYIYISENPLEKQSVDFQFTKEKHFSFQRKRVRSVHPKKAGCTVVCFALL